MRSLSVIALIVLAALLIRPDVASAAAAAPHGALERVQVNDFSNTAVLTGWTVDPAQRNQPSSIMVTVDGVSSGGWISTRIVRADVNRSQQATGGHGFNVTVTIPVGKHTICATSQLRAGGYPRLALGCFAFTAYPVATAADLQRTATSIDPRHSIAWTFAALPTGVAGEALPWANSIHIAAGNSVRHLRAVMLHEWSHVLQYRAFSGQWGNAVQAFNAAGGDRGDRTSYNGVEHGADCIALILGADYLGYGCTPALQKLSARVARGEKIQL